MADNYLNIPPILYRQVLNFLKAGRKINAIKALREGVADTNAQVGLKEAKLAVEKLAHDKAIPDIRSADHPDAMIIVSGPKIIKVVLDYGDGPVELDLEGMQIKALSEMHAIGLDACADMLEMAEVFRAISAGEKVQVVKAAEDS